MRGKYNCSVKNSSLRNLLTDAHLFSLWQNWNEAYGRNYRIVWNQFNSECFWISFRKTISLEFLRVCNLEDIILKINKQFEQWESSKKIRIIDEDSPDPEPIPLGRVDFG